MSTEINIPLEESPLLNPEAHLLTALDSRRPEPSKPDAWQAVESVLQNHHHQPDMEAARVLYSAVAAHKLAGAPVWVMLVAPPGSSKTELLMPLDGIERVH